MILFKLPHTLKIEQILQLLHEARKDGEREWLLILVAFLHALRASEAVGIRPVNIVGGKLVMKRKKGSHPVNDELLEHANPLLNERDALVELALKTPANSKLFPISTRTFQRWIHRYGERAGLPELFCHPHTLKHSILDYLRQNMSLVELQDRSGHKSLDSLRVYLHPEKDVTDRLVADALHAI